MKKLGQFLKGHGLNILGNIATGNVGGAINEVMEGIGIKKGASEDEILAELAKDKEYILKLKDMEMQHEREKYKLENERIQTEYTQKLEMTKAELEESKAIIADKDSARTREEKMVESDKATWLNKNISSILALVFVVFYLGLVTYSTIKKIEIKYLTDASTMIMLVLSYYFGAMNDKRGGK